MTSFNLETMVRILLAIALGGAIGFERELKHRPGVGQYWIAIISTALVFAILQIKEVEEKITSKENET